MKSVFFTYHPFVNFIFFCAVIGFGVLLIHPVFLCISLISALAYAVILTGKKMIKFLFAALVPITVLVTVINMLTNPRGSTVLYYTENSQITLEAIIFGILTGLLLSSIIIWFACYNEVMTSDKIMFLFGRLMPAMSLVFSMVMRFIPNYKNQIKKISHAQRCIGRDVSDGTIKEKIHHGIKIVSIMFTWALENSIDSADSMKARGYGLKGRSSFSIYRFDKRDMLMMAYIVAMSAVLIFGMITERCDIEFYPDIVMAKFDGISMLIYVSYIFLCFIPVVIEVKEVLLWKYFQSKI